MTITKSVKARDFTSGPLFLPILTFAIPIMLSGMLQTLYSIADNIVVGRFSGDPNVLAAVGSTGSFSALIVNLIIGITAGSSVVIAQHFGAKNEREVSRAVHTSLIFGLIGGIALMCLGLTIARPVLVLMGTKPEVLDSAVLYISIIFMGLPGSALYNFGATAMRATGNSRTPLIILGLSGLVNVILNLFFVIVCKMTVDGVALATIISQYLSAFAVLFLLHRSDECYSFRFSKLKIDRRMLLRILRIGLPAGVQSSLFAVSNMLIQSSVNTFTTPEIAGNTAGGNIEGFTYVALASYHHTAVTFAGQNVGANKPERVKKTLYLCILQTIIVGLVLISIQIPFLDKLALLFVDPNAENASLIIAATVKRLECLLLPYILCGIMDTLSGFLRGLGFSFITMCCSLFGACAFRIFWCAFIFPLDRFNSPEGLYVSYPISWVIVCVLYIVIIAYVFIKNMKRNKVQAQIT